MPVQWVVPGITMSVETWCHLGKLPTLFMNPPTPCMGENTKGPIFPIVTTNSSQHQRQRMLSLINSLESTTSCPWPGIGPSPLPDLGPGSLVGKRSWLLFCPLNYSHPNLGHWHESFICYLDI